MIVVYLIDYHLSRANVWNRTTAKAFATYSTLNSESRISLMLPLHITFAICKDRHFWRSKIPLSTWVDRSMLFYLIGNRLSIL